MSSILLSNPFPAPPPHATATQDAPALPPIGPVKTSHSASGTGDTGTRSGTGTGGGKQADAVALLRKSGSPQWPRPADATGGSIINAQAQSEDDASPFGINLPEVEMPYPLPTSPFLKKPDDTA